MQARMKKCPLAEEKIHTLLAAEPVGRLAGLGADGFPCCRPVCLAGVYGTVACGVFCFESAHW